LRQNAIRCLHAAGERVAVTRPHQLKEQFLSKGYPEPSDDYVKWKMLSRRALQHATEGNLRLCRNMYLVMADFLWRREKLKQALQM